MTDQTAHARVTVTRLRDDVQIVFEGPIEACYEFAARQSARPQMPRSKGAERATRAFGTRGATPARVRELKQALELLQPRSDNERIAVIATFAQRWNEAPVTGDYLSDWFERLELRQPARMSTTIANARAIGYLERVRRGVFNPSQRAIEFTDGIESATIIPLRKAAR